MTDAPNWIWLTNPGKAEERGRPIGWPPESDPALKYVRYVRADLAEERPAAPLVKTAHAAREGSSLGGPQATDAEALASAAKTLRAWTHGDALVNPAGAVKAMHSAADLLDQLAAGLTTAQQAGRSSDVAADYEGRHIIPQEFIDYRNDQKALAKLRGVKRT